MRPFADFVNATMAFRAPLLNRACCRVSRKYFFRNLLPAQWNCYGEGSKRTFLTNHSTAIELSTRGVRKSLELASPGQSGRYLTVWQTCASFEVRRSRWTCGRRSPSWVMRSQRESRCASAGSPISCRCGPRHRGRSKAGEQGAPGRADHGRSNTLRERFERAHFGPHPRSDPVRTQLF
jgi:hypothetical protein